LAQIIDSWITTCSVQCSISVNASNIFPPWN